MGRWPLAALPLAIASCVKAPAAPSAPVPVRGAYVLTVTASAVCALETSRFQWDVVATSVGTDEDMIIRVTLPEGDNDVDAVFGYVVEPNAPRDAPLTRVRGTLTARRAAFESTFITVEGSVRGVVSPRGPTGEIREGTISGRIAISDLPEEEDRTFDNVGSCSAADHQWSLAVRTPS